MSLPPVPKFRPAAAGRALCASLGMAILALAPLGCEVESSSGQDAAAGAAGASGDQTGPDGLPQPGARSVLGKARERAEKLVNEDVAEYNKKLEQAAEGKYP